MEMPVNMRRMGAPWRSVRVCVIVAMGPRRILRDLVIICIHGHLGRPTPRQFQFWGHKLGLGAAECARGGGMTPIRPGATRSGGDQLPNLIGITLALEQ